jgi:tetratricopeptide (TPR) repeat protein
MRNWQRPRSTLLHGLPLALVLGVTGCGDAPTPPPARVLQRTDVKLPDVEPLFADAPLSIEAPQVSLEPKQPESTPSSTAVAETNESASQQTQAISSSSISVRGVPDKSANTANDTVKTAQAVEPLPRVSDGQLTNAFEYPTTDAALTVTPTSPTSNDVLATNAPLLSSEPLVNSPVAASPALSKPTSIATFDPPLSTSAVTALPSAPRLHDATMLTNQASVEFQKGVALATRGSLFAARGKFLRCLDQLSLSGDAQSGGRVREPALQAALRALEEMEDFVGRRGTTTVQSDLTLIVRSHQTKLVTLDEAPQLTANEALVRYLQFAKQRLAESLQGMPHAAGPLHALGRVYDTLADRSSIVAAQDKARVFYEVAITIDPSHSAASNDLAVLLARHGRWNEAHGLLTRSVSLRPTMAGYQNLAVVQDRLGQPQLAARSRQLAASGGASAVALSDPALMPWQNVRWLEAKSFAQTSELASDPRPGPTKEPTKTNSTPTARTAANPDLRAAGRWQQ